MRTREDILDQLLVLRIQGGDVGALESLARRWHPRLLRHAVRLTGQLEAGADVAQEAWVAIVRGLGRLEDSSRFRSWAYRIVTRRSTDWIRRRQRRRRLASRIALEPAPPSASERQDEIRQVREALGRMPADRRALLSMYYVEGLSVGEIAEALSIPTGTVKSRLYHARNRLRASLEDQS